MKKPLLLAIILIFLVSINSVFAAGTIKNAVDLVKIGKNLQAIAILESIVKPENSPGNAEAWYELGNAYLANGNYSQAEDAYKNAVSLKPETFTGKVGTFYKSLGYKRLQSGAIDEARALFSRYLDYQPENRNVLAQNLYEKGQEALKQKNYGAEDGYLLLAAFFNHSLRKPICDQYAELGDLSDDENCIYFYDKLSAYCNEPNLNVGQRTLSLAKAIAKKPGFESRTEHYKQIARQHLGSFVVDQDLPDKKILEIGEHWFELEAGEKIPFWIIFPNETHADIKKTKGAQIEYFLINGETRSVEVGPLGGVGFTIHAITKTKIKIIVQQLK